MNASPILKGMPLASLTSTIPSPLACFSSRPSALSVHWSRKQTLELVAIGVNSMPDSSIGNGGINNTNVTFSSSVVTLGGPPIASNSVRVLPLSCVKDPTLLYGPTGVSTVVASITVSVHWVLDWCSIRWTFLVTTAGFCPTPITSPSLS